jgi:hypothetical protein
MSPQGPPSDDSRRTRTFRGCRAAAVLVTLYLALLLSPGRAHADAVWGWSPGVKLGWTFGYGVTYGFELSFVRLPDLDLHGGIVEVVFDGFGQFITRTYGIVFTLNTDFRKLFKMRVGAEWVGPGIGLEVGPTLVVDRHGTHLGIGLAPWLGYVLFGYYDFTLVLARAPNLHEMGLALKSPLLGFHGGGTHDDDWDD